ncbi:MAG: AAA family ATPase, partial [Nitrososphaerota archaeon]
MSESELRAKDRAEAQRSLPTISEVILENFMSYEYGRIRLKPGLNVICGPNGAGKSSILLAISVALGQAYTERSRRLSDLIRRGEGVARVTLLFDNRPRNGKRPIPFCRSDTFMLSRYLRSDGSYWFEADYREVSKGEVTRLFQRMGINPDNLLIIMHQGMLEEFSIISPQEKLKMLEEAVGFKEYREKVLEAKERLEGLLSKEKELTHILETTAQTVDYWKTIYERYLLKKGLLEKRALLERELLWANVIKIERSLTSLKEKREAKLRYLEDLVKRIEGARKSAEQAYSDLRARQDTLKKLYLAWIRLEREEARNGSKEELCGEALSIFQRLFSLIKGVASKDALDQLSYSADRFEAALEDSRRRRRDLGQEIIALKGELERLEGEVLRSVDGYVGLRVKEALLAHQKKGLEREIAELNRCIKDAEEEL